MTNSDERMMTLCRVRYGLVFQRIFQLYNVTQLRSYRACQFDRFDHFRLRDVVLDFVVLILVVLVGERHLNRFLL